MSIRYVILASLAVLLAGCVDYPNGVPGIQAAQSGPTPGYRYYDNNHPNWVNQPSAQAIYNAQHNTYLWPPSSTDWP